MRVSQGSMTGYGNDGRQALLTLGRRGIIVLGVFVDGNQRILPRTGTLNLGRPVHSRAVAAERFLGIGLEVVDDQGRAGTTGARDRRWSILGGVGTFPGHWLRVMGITVEPVHTVGRRVVLSQSQSWGPLHRVERHTD